jgi:hypothetical protein
MGGSPTIVPLVTLHRTKTKFRAFVDNLLNFIGVGVVLYSVANLYAYFSKKSILKYSIKCPFCRKLISSKVRQIPFPRTILTKKYGCIGETVSDVYVLDGRERRA